MSSDSVNSTIALVTGANKGIGRAVASGLAKRPNYIVLIGARNLSAAQELATELKSAGYQAEGVQLDLESDESVATAAQTINDKFGRLDVLVNNAGVLLDYRGPGTPKLSTRTLFEKTFSTNVIGTACLTDALLPLLRKAASHPRVVFVSSRMGSLAEATNREMPFFSFDFKAYDSSKAAVNLLALNYARLLEDVGGIVNVACPGLVSTDLNDHNSAGSTPEEGARRIIELATLDKGSQTATFSDRDGAIPW